MIYLIVFFVFLSLFTEEITALRSPAQSNQSTHNPPVERGTKETSLRNKKKNTTQLSLRRCRVKGLVKTKNLKEK